MGKGELPLVGLAPNVHGLGSGNELVPELGCSHGNQALGTLPGGLALDVEHAMLGDHIVEVAPGAGGDGALNEGGTDAGLHLTGGLVLKVEEQQMKLLPPRDR